MKKRLLQFGAATLALAALAGAYAVWGPQWPWIGGRQPESTESAKPESPTEVVLTPEKFQALQITCVTVTKQLVQEERTVPGDLEYRRVRRTELKAPVDSVVQKVLVKPGDVVKPGTRLALLTSPDVGLVRAEVERSQSELAYANRAFEWAAEITGNLEDLLKFLENKPRTQLVEKEFEQKRLGTHRQDVLPAYSKYRLAEQIWEGTKNAIGSLPEKTIQERESNREVTWEQYLAVCEQSRFDARQAREKARQNQLYAQRLVDVSRQKLNTLLGSFSEVVSPGEAPRNDAQLTYFYLIAPFEGTVEERLTSDSQRVAAETPLFSVANVEVLEVLADIREGDWQVVAPYFAADSKTRPPLKVTVPALGEERQFEARVDYVGRMVDPVTRAVPLVALLDNSTHEFKPGMFAWIRIPAGPAEEDLVVPPAAVRTHQGQTFVFVEDQKEPRKYQRVDVTIGKQTPEWVMVANGLTPGQRVVVTGSFALKNELLLEPEED